jgi:GTP cyclohydrolase I
MIDAQHYCVKSRGVEDAGSSTVTCRLGGGFKTDPQHDKSSCRLLTKVANDGSLT